MDDASQPCVGCGRATKPGTPLFSDRTTARTDEGEPLYLCGACNERAASQFGRRLTGEDIRDIATRAQFWG
jgi:hypothetical protein